MGQILLTDFELATAAHSAVASVELLTADAAAMVALWKVAGSGNLVTCFDVVAFSATSLVVVDLVIVGGLGVPGACLGHSSSFRERRIVVTFVLCKMRESKWMAGEKSPVDHLGLD